MHEAAGEARRALDYVHGLLDRLRPVIERDLYHELDAAVNELDLAIRLEYPARLARAAVEAFDHPEPAVLVLAPTVREGAP